MKKLTRKQIQKLVDYDLKHTPVPEDLHIVVDEFNRTHPGLREYSESIYNIYLLTRVYNAGLEKGRTS